MQHYLARLLREQIWQALDWIVLILMGLPSTRQPSGLIISISANTTFLVLVIDAEVLLLPGERLSGKGTGEMAEKAESLCQHLVQSQQKAALAL